MQIQQVTRHTLNELVSGRLAASILDGAWSPGQQLPPERELMDQLGVSRATLREALKALAEDNLIEARPGVGWFVKAIDRPNVARAHKLAAVYRHANAENARVCCGANNRGCDFGRQPPMVIKLTGATSSRGGPA